MVVPPAGILAKGPGLVNLIASLPVALLARLGLDDPKVRAWAMYDWANSAFVTVVITAIYPTYVTGSARAAGVDLAADFSLVTTIALALAAILGPILGTLSDVRPVKKRVLTAGMLVGVAGTLGLAVLPPTAFSTSLLVFAAANIGLNLAQTAYDALLPHVAPGQASDRVSLAGYAMGYLGGGLVLTVCVALVLGMKGQGALAARLGFVLTAVWWLVFSIPLLRRVPEPPVAPSPAGPLLRVTFRQLGHTFRDLRRHRHAFMLLVAFLIYNDGVGTIFRMATLFAAEMQLPQTTTIVAILLVQFIGLPCTFLYAGLARKVGTRTAILLGLGVYTFISVLGFFMGTPVLNAVLAPATQFVILAVLVGLVQGGVQALSRSLFARLTPPSRSGEFFGLFAVFEKFAGILGPAVFAITIRATGSTRPAILSIVVFFVVGALLLLRVNVVEGERAAGEQTSPG
jgi:UMF1 family MFS transporter